MKFIEPEVYVLGETWAYSEGVADMIDTLGGDGNAWLASLMGAPSNGEMVTQVAGRMCYRSFELGLNPNVTRIRQDSKDYIGNILKSGHGSVLEHSTVNLAFMNVSRVFTHELVRHGEGTAFSQESMRFVRVTELAGWFPKCFEQYTAYLPGEGPDVGGDSIGDRARMIMERAFDHAAAAYHALGELFNIDNPNMDFATKKKLTSAMRRVLPDGMATHIIMTANHRALRHIMNVRNSEHAEEELQLVFRKLGSMLKAMYPLIYQDMEQDPNTGEWSFQYPKV